MSSFDAACSPGVSTAFGVAVFLRRCFGVSAAEMSQHKKESRREADAVSTSAWRAATRYAANRIKISNNPRRRKLLRAHIKQQRRNFFF